MAAACSCSVRVAFDAAVGCRVSRLPPSNQVKLRADVCGCVSATPSRISSCSSSTNNVATGMLNRLGAHAIRTRGRGSAAGCAIITHNWLPDRLVAKITSLERFGAALVVVGHALRAIATEATCGTGLLGTGRRTSAAHAVRTQSSDACNPLCTDAATARAALSCLHLSFSSRQQ
jgi:hypothetical protein